MKIELLRGLWTKNFHSADGMSMVAFKEWISSTNYQVNNIISPTTVELFVRDTHSLNNTLAFDCSRMACAAIESAHGIVKAKNFPQSTAWAAIRMYYAAFFAAHSILRIFGYTCSQLERGHVKLIQELASATFVGGTLKPEGGFFIGQFSSSGNIVLKKMSDSHKDTWTKFHALLKNLSNDITKLHGLSKDQLKLSMYFSDLYHALENGGKHTSGNWLSQFRNNINYRHEYGAWFPYTSDSIAFDEIQCYLIPWKEDHAYLKLNLLEKNELKRFFIVCASILYLCKSLIVDAERVCPSRKSIYNKVPLAFIRRTLG